MIDVHIPNPHEILDLKLTGLLELADDAFSGALTNVVEKIDGQNLTFTVNDDDKVLFKGKGQAAWISDRNGLSIDETRAHLCQRDLGVASSFCEALNIIQALVYRDPKKFKNACLGGMRDISAEIVTPFMKNVIVYPNKRIYLHGIIPNNDEDFDTFTKAFPKQALEWIVIRSPRPAFKGIPDRIRSLNEISIKIRSLRDELKLSPGSTVEDASVALLVRRLLATTSISPAIMPRAAMRLLTAKASHIRHDEFCHGDWDTFKEIENERITFVGDALIPLERISQLIGSRAIEAYEFSAADTTTAIMNGYRTQVQEIRSAMQQGRVIASPELLARIASSLRRLDESLFTKNAEGMIFIWRGKKMKLSGAFPALNRLLGHFKYGQAPAWIET
jgi:hypothetical protein